MRLVQTITLYGITILAVGAVFTSGQQQTTHKNIDKNIVQTLTSAFIPHKTAVKEDQNRILLEAMIDKRTALSGELMSKTDRDKEVAQKLASFYQLSQDKQAKQISAWKTEIKNMR